MIEPVKQNVPPFSRISHDMADSKASTPTNPPVTSKVAPQVHPQWRKDRTTLDGILQGEATDLSLVELARLAIRYNGFPGAADIKKDLAIALKRWDLTEDSLFAKTREIHAQGRAYVGADGDREDWS